MKQQSRLVLLVLVIAGLSVGLTPQPHSPSGHGGSAGGPRPTSTSARHAARAVGTATPLSQCDRPPCAAASPTTAPIRHIRRQIPSRVAHARNTGRLTSGFTLEKRRLGDVFGVGAFVTQRGNAYSRLLVARAGLLGARWVREEFTATRLHSGPDAPYQWAPFDRVVREERTAGIHVLGLLDYSNTWGYPNHGWMPHSNIARLSADFARYAYAVARHYRGQIDVWQVWNEPNLGMFWRPAPNPEDYARLVHAAYRAIKRANPRARVVLAGLSGVDLDFLRRIAARTRDFDIISVHPYRNEPESRLLQQVRTLQQWHRPIWFSEVGWAAGQGCGLCTDEGAQARYLVRFYALSAAAGVQRIFWYDLRDDSNPASSPEAHFGLLRHNLSGKPAFAAYAFLSRLLRGATFVHADLAGSRGLYALHFDLRTGPLTMLWTTGGVDQTITFPWETHGAQAFGLDGTPEGDVAVQSGQASWAVPGDGTPVYVMSSSPYTPFRLPGALLHPRPRPLARHLAVVSRPRRRLRPAPHRLRPRARTRRVAPVRVPSRPHAVEFRRAAPRAARSTNLQPPPAGASPQAREHRVALPTAGPEVTPTVTETAGAPATPDATATDAGTATPAGTATAPAAATSATGATATSESDQPSPSVTGDELPPSPVATTTSAPASVTP